MKKKMGRLICLSITASMALSSVPFTAMAEDTLPGVVQTQTTEDETTSGDAIEVEEGKFAVYQNGETTPYDTLEEAITEAQSGAIIKLGADAEVNTLGAVAETGKLTFDLNGHRLEYTGAVSSSGSNAELTFTDSTVTETGTRGGTLDLTGVAVNKCVFNPQLGATVNAENIRIECTGSVFYPQGNAAAVNITNCYVKAAVYCVGTNAGSDDNYGIAINLKDSEFVSSVDGGDNCTILLNVGGTLDIDNCEITGDKQAVIVRAGTADITNSEITVTGTYTGNQNNWTDGNNIPPGALVVGNYVDGEASAYKADADVNVSDTIITSENSEVPAIYADSNESYESNIDITGASTVVTGTVETGQYNKNHEGRETSDINIYAGRYYSSESNPNTSISEYIADGNKIENGQVIIDNENAVAQIDDMGFKTLKEAAGVAKDGDVIELLQNIIYGSSDDYTIPEGVTVLVPEGKSLTVGGLGILGSKGSIEVEAGGKLLVPESVIEEDSQSNGNVAFVGTTDDDTSRLVLTDGSINVNFGEALVTIKAGAKAEIPENKTTYLIVGPTGSKTALSAVVEENAELTVNGRLRAASGNNGSTVTVKGTVNAADGELSIARNAKVVVEETGNVAMSSTSFVNIIGQVSVNAGGAVSVDGENWIGGDDATINVISGSVTANMNGLASDDQSENKDKVVITIDGEAQVPEGKRWTLKIGGINTNVNVEINGGSKLVLSKTAEGLEDTFRVANNSKLTNNGTIVVESGSVMTVSSKGIVDGTGTIETSGTFVNNITDTSGGRISNSITAYGGKIYSQSDISSLFGDVELNELADKYYGETEYSHAYEVIEPVAEWGSSADSYEHKGTIEQAFASESEFIKLNGNVQLSDTISVSRNKTLDLNGFTITAAEEKSIFLVSPSAVFTLNDSSEEKDGTITGAVINDNSNGAAVTIQNGGTFIMNGGNITNNVNNGQGAGGVHLHKNASFTMNGGAITNNTSNYIYGGVYAGAGVKSVTVSGNVNITGNKGAELDGTVIDSDLWLNTINNVLLDIGDSGLSTEAKIGVYINSAVSDVKAFTNPISSGLATVDNFFSNTAKHEVVEIANDDGTFQFAFSLKKAEVPVATPEAGTYTEEQTVELSTVTLPDYTRIYYTTDGTDPVTSETRQLYSEPFTISETTTIKAYVDGVSGDCLASDVVTFEYVINKSDTPDPEPSEPSVLLSQTSGQVEVKGTLNITEYITNESKNTFKEFAYESEYTEYATVDENGVVTGVKETDGVDIIVTGKGIDGKPDYTTSTAFNLEVVAKDEPTEPEEPTELSLELVENSGSVRVGREFSLASDEYIKDFDKFTAGFTYSSNDTSIATVDGNGLVEGVNRGSTTINIIANESDDYTLTTSHAAFTLNVTRSSNGEDSSSSSSGGGGGSSSSSGYSVSTSSSDNGSFTVDKDRASSGSTVTITANPDEGYEVGKVTVTDADGNEITVRDKGNNQYTFTMPSSRVTIDVEFVESETTEEVTEPSEETTMPFTDVDENDWFYDAVKYAYENGLMSGTALDTFSPDTNTTRGMIVSILYRLEGSPAVTERAAFTDVESGQYYADAVAWAAANGIVSGYDAFTFGPNDNITREQMASILYRYAQYKGIDTSAAGNLAAFSDNASISAYARTAISWAVGEGLVSGMGDGTLAPQGQATRAQVASILMRFAQM